MTPKEATAQDRQISSTSLQLMLAQLHDTVAELSQAGSFAERKQRIAVIDAQLSKGWDQLDNAPQLQRERAHLLNTTLPLEQAHGQLDDLEELLRLGIEEQDESLLADIDTQFAVVKENLAQIELANLLSRPHAESDAYLDVHFGSGGTESQDWAQMLKRMYVGYASTRGWQTSMIEETFGEAGIKSATVLVKGTNAYGLLRTETGIHRLVRKSPFDSNHRRHTSFASVFVYPVLPESEEVEINPADLRIDTYRSSGAGGQHVNTTDSAVRITHLPTNIVVQCQNNRSQHKNRATAMSMLRSRLQMLRKAQEGEHKKKIEDSKSAISWGSQIRSYVLDQSRVKDLRTGEESGKPQAVLDGDDLHRFIEASLRKNF